MIKCLIALLLVSTNLYAIEIINGDLGKYENNAQFVRPWHQGRQQRALFAQDANGVSNMAINAAFGGTPEKIHNGTDSVEWTATAVSGTWDFASTDEAKNGTKSIDASLSINGSTFKMQNGAITANYEAITGWIKITKWDQGDDSISIYGWDTTANAQIGDAVQIENFVSQTEIGSWQPFTLQTTDFAFSTTNINSGS